MICGGLGRLGDTIVRCCFIICLLCLCLWDWRAVYLCYFFFVLCDYLTLFLPFSSLCVCVWGCAALCVGWKCEYAFGSGCGWMWIGRTTIFSPEGKRGTFISALHACTELTICFYRFCSVWIVCIIGRLYQSMYRLLSFRWDSWTYFALLWLSNPSLSLSLSLHWL